MTLLTTPLTTPTPTTSLVKTSVKRNFVFGDHGGFAYHFLPTIYCYISGKNDDVVLKWPDDF